MKPIGATLLDWKAICESFPGLDPREAHAGHAVHVWGEKQSVPVNRRIFFQTVRDPQRRLLTFFQPNHWTRDCSIDRHRHPGSSVEVEHLLADGQIDHISA